MPKGGKADIFPKTVYFNEPNNPDTSTFSDEKNGVNLLQIAGSSVSPDTRNSRVNEVNPPFLLSPPNGVDMRKVIDEYEAEERQKKETMSKSEEIQNEHHDTSNDTIHMNFVNASATNNSDNNNNNNNNNNNEEKLPQEDSELIKQRIVEQQMRWKEFEQRDNQMRLKALKQVYDYITDEEGLAALEECLFDEEEAIEKLMDYNYLVDIRRRIAKQKFVQTYGPNQQTQKSQSTNFQLFVSAPEVSVLTTETTSVPVVNNEVSDSQKAEKGSDINSNTLTANTQTQTLTSTLPLAETQNSSILNSENERSVANDEDSDDTELDGLYISDDEVESDNKRKRKRTRKQSTTKRKHREMKNATANSDEKSESEEKSQNSLKKNKSKDAASSESKESFNEKEIYIRKKKKKVTLPKLRLDDAIAQGHMEGWSSARIRAWSLREQNPNAYYYRFNEPGEKQRNGKWSEAEKKLFFDRMKEVGVNGQWGLFSRAIPGRVGYQCANFYRQLIESGEVYDPRYVLDAKGKAHFKFKHLQNPDERPRILNPKYASDTPIPMNNPESEERSKSESERKESKKRMITRIEAEDDTDENVSLKKKRKVSKQKTKKKETRQDPEDEDYKPRFSVQDEETVENKRYENPLPGYMDPITLEEVVQPAISPYGHVMGYQTWLNCLLQEPKNTCPITKRPLHKRELVILTFENIDQYRDKIIKI